jgi:hypothetical protein
LSITAAYVGGLGHRLPFAVDLNYPTYNSTATTGNVNNRRPIEPLTLAQIYNVESIMNTSYNALQFTVERRLAQHISFKGFYTYGKDLEDSELDNNTVNGGAEDYHNLGLERGRSDNDRRQAMSGSVIWNLDYLKGSSSVLRAVANNWQLSGIVTMQSGLPINITSGSDINLDGNNNDRVELLGNPYLDPHRSRSDVSNAWFNTAAFAKPAAGTDGNLGRNVLSAPGYKDVDLGLFRNFKIKERFALQLRGEFSNAFNMVSLSAPTLTLSSAQFGKIVSASAMRNVQLGLRLTF